MCEGNSFDGRPGNVRELRNAVERAVLLPNHPTLGFEAPPKKEGQFGEVDIDVPFKVAKQKLVDEVDRKYLEALLEAHDNNISAAAAPPASSACRSTR